MRSTGFLFLFALFIITLGVSAGNAMPQEETKTVSGFVSDSSDGETLIGAAVSIKGLPNGQKAGAVTNKQGYYVIQNIPPGKYTLRCTYLGYRKQETDVDVRSGDVKVNIILPPEA